MQILAILMLLASFMLVTFAESCSSVDQVKVTFYGYPDNDPPGPAISCPGGCGPHGERAGGDGSFGNPLTMAAADGVFSPGEVVYLPYLQKYLRYEDFCASCSGAWVDVWTGSPDSNGGEAQIQCENRLTPGGNVPLIRNPLSNLNTNSTETATRVLFIQVLKQSVSLAPTKLAGILRWKEGNVARSFDSREVRAAAAEDD
ncbi:hypothetical protein BT63DRAFT_466111 [Microthyrium microscopicum]|uniref:Uncharacterized protein n=1 Tax=Microthyrium microscopicum TaxID=703497 RepID=A0A6A6TTH1_9PEZI|nr:hypothetical protein BT63DRAFT_466111 [Microthyrium microscopicum]